MANTIWLNHWLVRMPPIMQEEAMIKARTAVIRLHLLVHCLMLRRVSIRVAQPVPTSARVAINVHMVRRSSSSVQRSESTSRTDSVNRTSRQIRSHRSRSQRRQRTPNQRRQRTMARMRVPVRKRSQLILAFCSKRLTMPPSCLRSVKAWVS